MKIQKIERKLLNNNLQFLEVLLKSRTFSQVPKTDLEKMLSFCHFKNYKKREYIFNYGDEAKYLYIVFKGVVETYLITENYSKKILSTAKPADILDISPLFKINGQHFCNGVCVEDSTIAVISKKDFIENVLNIKSLALVYMQLMGYIIHNNTMDKIIKSAEAKVAAFLNYSINKTAYIENGEINVPKKISYPKMAEILDLTRETINRTFKHFEKEKLIKLDSKSYIIYNKSKIQKIANDCECLTGFYGTIS